MKSKSEITLEMWILLCAVGILIFLMNVDYTAVSLTLLPISKEIGEDLNNLQWMLSGYTLVWASFVIPAGRFADIYGKKTALLLGLTIFALSSAMISASSQIEYLIAGRIAQGIGAAIFTAPCWAVIFSSAPPEKQGFVMGIVLTFSGIGLSTGPTLGGFLIQNFDWRWIFYVNIPISIFVGLVFLWVVKSEPKRTDATKIDILGTILLSSGLCLSVYALNQIEVWGAGIKLFSTLAAGIIIVGTFFIYDSKRKEKMIPNSLLKNRAFMSCSVACFFIAMTFSLVLVLMGIYLQRIVSYSSYHAGLIFFAMTISMGFLSPFGGQIVDRLGVRLPLIAATFMIAIGTGLMSLLDAKSSIYMICSSLFFAGTGIGIFFTAGNIAMMRSVPAQDLNIASGVYTTWMMLGNTISIILYSSLLVLFARLKLITSFSTNNDVNEETKTVILSNLGKLGEPLSSIPGITDNLILEITNALADSFSLNMLIGTISVIGVYFIIRNSVKSLDKKDDPKDQSAYHISL